MIKLSSLTKDWYRTGELAKMIGVTTRTVQRYCMEGLIKDVIKDTGKRVISKDEIIKYLNDNGMLIDDLSNTRVDVIYARVSSSKQKNDLDRQVNEIIRYVVDKNPKNLETITDISSGLNDNRKGLNRLLDMVMKDKIDRVFISYKDRLTRFGFNYIDRLCKFHNTEIVIISNEIKDKSISEELAEDIIAIIHLFSGKLYGLRNSVKDKVNKVLSDERSCLS